MSKHKGYNTDGSKQSPWFNPDKPQTGTGKNYPDGVKDTPEIVVIHRDNNGKRISRG